MVFIFFVMFGNRRSGLIKSVSLPPPEAVYGSDSVFMTGLISPWNFNKMLYFSYIGQSTMLLVLFVGYAF